MSTAFNLPVISQLTYLALMLAVSLHVVSESLFCECYNIPILHYHTLAMDHKGQLKRIAQA